MGNEWIYPGAALAPGGGSRPISELFTIEEKRREAAPALRTQAAISRGAAKKPTAAIAQPAATRPVPAPQTAAPAPYSSGPYYSGDVERDTAKWREDAGRRVDERTAAIKSRRDTNATLADDWRNVQPGQSVNEYRSGVEGGVANQPGALQPGGAVQRMDISPASGGYNQRNVDLRRDQDAYWGARKADVDARYALDNYTNLSPSDKLRYMEQAKGAQTTLGGMREAAAARESGAEGRRSALQIAELGSTGALERAKLSGTQGMELEQMRQKDPMRQAQAGLYGAQAEEAKYAATNREKIARQKAQSVQDKAYMDVLGEIIKNGTPEMAQRASDELRSMFGGGRRTPSPEQREATIQAVMKDEGVDYAAASKKVDQHMQSKQGYADGGAVGLNNLPQMDESFRQANDYKRYAQTAAAMGATPVPFDQFASLQQAATMQAAQPQGYAYGGEVEGDYEDGYGYANGGAIQVGGRQVLGPGTGKSDSIPAVIDGERPAALSTGEFVFPTEAVAHFGLDKLNKMVESARKNQRT